jgi:phytoene dehydrogenase-like protein
MENSARLVQRLLLGILPANDDRKSTLSLAENQNDNDLFQQTQIVVGHPSGVDASVITNDFHCHHLLLEDWAEMESEQGVIFVSIPTLLDPSLAPEGRHIVHTFTTMDIQAWKTLSPADYKAKKAADAAWLVQRLEAILPGFGAAIHHQEIGTPRTHRRFLGRMGGSYGPIPALRLPDLLPPLPAKLTPLHPDHFFHQGA